MNKKKTIEGVETEKVNFFGVFLGILCEIKHSRKRKENSLDNEENEAQTSTNKI